MQNTIIALINSVNQHVIRIKNVQLIFFMKLFRNNDTETVKNSQYYFNFNYWAYYGLFKLENWIVSITY